MKSNKDKELEKIKELDKKIPEGFNKMIDKALGYNPKDDPEDPFYKQNKKKKKK